MAARRPNTAAAFIDLAFAIAAGACGAFALGLHVLLGVLAAHVVYWAVSRQNSLRAAPRAQLPGIVAVSVALLVAVDFAAYFIGQFARTNFS